MTARGTDARRLTTGPFPLPSADDPSEVATNDAGTTSIAWSPNGTRLAFDAQNATFPPTCMHNCVDWRVFVVNADGSDLHQVADQARSPRWSSDGLRLAVVGTVSPYGDSESVEIVPLTSAPVVRIPAFSPFSFQPPSWSPRGVVAFQGFRGDNPPLRVQTADAAGAHRRVLGAGAQPVWSPDGMRLAFVRSGRLMVMDANGKGLRRLSSRRRVRVVPGVVTQRGADRVPGAAGQAARLADAARSRGRAHGRRAPPDRRATRVALRLGARLVARRGSDPRARLSRRLAGRAGRADRGGRARLAAAARRGRAAPPRRAVRAAVADQLLVDAAELPAELV